MEGTKTNSTKKLRPRAKSVCEKENFYLTDREKGEKPNPKSILKPNQNPSSIKIASNSKLTNAINENMTNDSHTLYFIKECDCGMIINEKLLPRFIREPDLTRLFVKCVDCLIFANTRLALNKFVKLIHKSVGSYTEIVIGNRAHLRQLLDEICRACQVCPNFINETEIKNCSYCDVEEDETSAIESATLQEASADKMGPRVLLKRLQFSDFESNNINMKEISMGETEDTADNPESFNDPPSPDPMVEVTAKPDGFEFRDVRLLNFETNLGEIPILNDLSSNFDELMAALKTPPKTPPHLISNKIELPKIEANTMDKLILMDNTDNSFEGCAAGAVGLEAGFLSSPVNERENAMGGTSDAKPSDKRFE